MSGHARSDELRRRARRVIPAGAHTYSKGDDQFPACAPGFIQRGLGARVWDVDGNEWLDWGMGLRSVILGHAHEPVLEAVRAQLPLGSNFTRPSPIEVELAERLVQLIPCAEMVKLAKNGSDVTTAAVKLARAFTGRRVVARCLDHPFFSVHDWFIGDTPCDAGIPEEVKRLTVHFRYNAPEELEALLQEHEVAAVILEPAAGEAPREGYLERVRELTRRHGAVLIFDEMITGLRWHPAGAQALYGVTPDLATFGKALANGFSVSALVGRREIMELGGLEHSRPRVFLLSSTHGGETHSIAAALATLREVEERRVDLHVARVGQRLLDGFNALCRELGIEARAGMSGLAASPYHVFRDAQGRVDLGLRTLFLQEMLRGGVLIPYVATSAAHGELELERTLEASRAALRVVRRAIEQGGTEGLLDGPIVKPVFRRYN